MSSFDYAVLVIVGISVLLAVLRGGVSEILSLAAWTLGFWLAQGYAVTLGDMLPSSVPSPELRAIGGFLGILLGVWFGFAIIRATLSQLLSATGLGPLDRVLGAVFGLLRGVLIVLSLVLVAGMTNLPRTSMWQNAMFSAPFEAMASLLLPHLPAELASRIKFE